MLLLLNQASLSESTQNGLRPRKQGKRGTQRLIFSGMCACVLTLQIVSYLLLHFLGFIFSATNNLWKTTISDI